MSDPYDWNPPDLPPEQMTDADWLRSQARANFITEDIERADRIAARLDGRCWYVVTHTRAPGHPIIREWQTFSSREVAEQYRDGVLELQQRAGHRCVATVCEGDAMNFMDI